MGRLKAKAETDTKEITEPGGENGKIQFQGKVDGRYRKFGMLPSLGYTQNSNRNEYSPKG